MEKQKKSAVDLLESLKIGLVDIKRISDLLII